MHCPVVTAPENGVATVEPEADNEVIRVVGVHKKFGTLEVLKGIDLSVQRGSVVTILGPSGGGKSTLLRCINGLDWPDRGCVFVDGAPLGFELKKEDVYFARRRVIREQRRQLSMVFQHFNLFPHLTALQNVTLGPVKSLKIPARAARETALMALERVGLKDKVDAYPASLSGGQKQRVAIARAITMAPKAILFDEPTSALDPQLVGEVLTVIKELAADGTTMVIVTHEIAFAREVSDHVVVVLQGSVVEEGPAELLDSPRRPETREFLARFIDR